jgi:hypothetical protein
VKIHRNVIYCLLPRVYRRQGLPKTEAEPSLNDRGFSQCRALALGLVFVLSALPHIVRAQAQSSGIESSPRPQTQPLAKPTAGSAIRGKQLFLGQIHFQTGGPPCASCHSIAGLSFPDGGTLGPNLTHEYSKLGPEGTEIALKTLYFPAMSPIYDSRPLSPEEQADLQAFLKEASASHETRSDTLAIAVLGLLGFFVLLVVTRFMWRGRLQSVRQRLLEKARTQGGLEA